MSQRAAAAGTGVPGGHAARSATRHRRVEARRELDRVAQVRRVPAHDLQAEVAQAALTDGLRDDGPRRHLVGRPAIALAVGKVLAPSVRLADDAELGPQHVDPTDRPPPWVGDDDLGDAGWQPPAR